MEKMRIMVVDDEFVVRESLYHWFSKEGYSTTTCASGEEALEALEKAFYDILFVDMKMPGMDGFDVLEKAGEIYPETSVVIITAYGSIDTAVKAMKSGAVDYLLKPFKPEQLSLVMEKIMYQKKVDSEYRYLKGQLDKVTRFDNIIGESPPMQKIYDTIDQLAESDTPVLIFGETGTGKELVAKAIHAKSLRNQSPFVPINCGALPDSLLESELFGYARGAFTGADHARKGFLEVVSGGTLFLDEIGEISSKMQVDLLRVLQEKKITRLGENQQTEVDFRLISATRQDLEAKVAEGAFRNDFFFRINVISITIPPLAERRTDIPLLVDHFISKYSQETTRQIQGIDKNAVAFLMDHDWPGNVRELENAVERAVVLSKSRILTASDFDFVRSKRKENGKNRPQTLKDMERAHIKKILTENNWNISKSSKILGIGRSTLHRMIKRHGLEQT